MLYNKNVREIKNKNKGAMNMGYTRKSYEEYLVNLAEEYFTKEYLYDELLQALSSDEIRDNLSFILRMNDVRHKDKEEF